MFGLQLAFDSPWFLLLLGIAPLLWVVGYRSLGTLGRGRQWSAIALRTAVLALLAMALAEPQIRRSSDRITVIYLLDQSTSIPAAQREAMVQFVRQAVRRHRNSERGDRAGIVVFGREAFIEVPPFDDHLNLGATLEMAPYLRQDATNLESALKLAQAMFQEDTARRIVVVSDGNENEGDAHSLVPLLAQSMIGIDVVPIIVRPRGEVMVDRISLPAVVQRGEPFEAQVVVTNHSPGTDLASGAPSSDVAHGTLRLSRRRGGSNQTLVEREVSLPPGKTVFRFEHEIALSDFYEYQATFIPQSNADDQLTQNNRATAFTHVRGQGHLLLIEDWENPGEFAYLADRLRNADLEVTLLPSNQLYASLAELQRYDTVILANVPRSSGFNAQTITHFSDEQIRMLVRNTEQMGAGLIVLGGPNGLGAGGWANSELEEAMPVDFSVENPKIVPKGALVMTMHASEMAQGNYWQRRVAEEAFLALSPHDHCGVIAGANVDQWLWTEQGEGVLSVGDHRRMMRSRMNRMTPGDAQDYEPCLQLALRGFQGVPQASHRQMILISDGDPSPPRAATLQRFLDAKIPIATVAIGAHGQSSFSTLHDIATATGGTFYAVTDPRSLPRIFQREARRISRPLIYEPGHDMQPQVIAAHEITQGITELPPISGYVLTTVKDNPLVEVVAASPEPTGQQNATLLASWTYGLGRTAVLTTDAGARWADRWTRWEEYDRLFTQLVRWSMRPDSDSANFQIALEEKQGIVNVVVSALGQDDSFLDFLEMSGTVVGPDLEGSLFRLEQVAPGRYVGQFEGSRSGSYMVSVHPGPGYSLLRTGVNIPYPAEYRLQETNETLLVQLASLQPIGGSPGQVATGEMTPGQFESLLQVDPFRDDLPPAISSDIAWPLLVVAAGCLFFADVLVRRVSLSTAWLLWPWLRITAMLNRRDADAAPEERIARLQLRKREVQAQIGTPQATASFDSSRSGGAVSGGSPSDRKEAAQADAASMLPTVKPPKLAEQDDPATSTSAQSSYLKRLQQAKQRASQQREQHKEQPPFTKQTDDTNGQDDSREPTGDVPPDED